MNELANKDTLVLLAVAGSVLTLTAGTMIVGTAAMLTFWVRRAGPGAVWLFLALSIVLVAVDLGDSAYRELVFAIALVAMLVQAVTLWWVVLSWRIVADQLDPDDRRGLRLTLVLSLASTALFAVCSIYGGFWAH